jgi:outer membrane protein assembly factor BamB
MRLAMIGLGRMGMNMARRLLKGQHELVAYNTNGTERWTCTFSDPEFRIRYGDDLGCPAIGHDGTIYVPGMREHPKRPAVVAVTTNGIESWMYVDPVEYWRSHAPVVDGSNTILVPCKERITAISPIDGSEMWQADLAGLGYVASAPAIGDSGVLYVVSSTNPGYGGMGYLIAFSHPFDCDGDGDVDLDNFVELAACLEGPGGGLESDCDCYDFDDSGDVDLIDFAAFQEAFMSP